MIDIGIENSTAFKMSGKITKDEMTSVLADAKEKTKRYGNIVIYEEIESFEGVELAAIVEEFKYLLDVGISNIGKAVVVTDKKWIEVIADIEDKIFRKIDIKCFSLSDKELAIKYLKDA